MTSDAEISENDMAGMGIPFVGTDENGRLVLTSDQSDLSSARRATADYLRHRCDWVESDAVLLVVSELLSNAMIHGGGWWSLAVNVSESRLLIEVRDRETVTPAVRAANPDGAAGGMGLHIVAKLVSKYEAVVDPTGTGKTVSALWDRPSPLGSAWGI